MREPTRERRSTRDECTRPREELAVRWPVCSSGRCLRERARGVRGVRLRGHGLAGPEQRRAVGVGPELRVPANAPARARDRARDGDAGGERRGRARRAHRGRACCRGRAEGRGLPVPAPPRLPRGHERFDDADARVGTAHRVAGGRVPVGEPQSLDLRDRDGRGSCRPSSDGSSASPWSRRRS